MSEKQYTCICGRVFDSPNSFNGHKSHCKVHQLDKHGSLDFYKQVTNLKNKKIRKTALYNSSLKHEQINQNWANEKHTCEKCGKVMTEKYGSGRFCSRSCANSRIHSAETKQRICRSALPKLKKSAKERHRALVDLYNLNPNTCIVCNSVLSYDKRNCKVCDSVSCKHQVASLSGRKSAQKQAETRRSKAEIYFCQLCEKHFKNVEHNVPIFDGWDADVVIHDIKYAVLWNGIWHYEKIKSNQSIKQIQSRDALKIKKIIECSYTPYVIKDTGDFNKQFVEEKFNEFLTAISYVK